MRQTATLIDAIVSSASGASSALTSLTKLAPHATASRMRSGLRVSTDSGMPRRKAPRAPAARVCVPPRAASVVIPAASILRRCREYRRPRRSARAMRDRRVACDKQTAVRKESGVVLTTPMMRGTVQCELVAPVLQASGLREPL